MNTLAFIITLILSITYTPTLSIRNSLNTYHNDDKTNPEIIIFHDYESMDQDIDEIRSIHKYNPNDYDHDVIDHHDDSISDSNVVAPPGPIDNNDDDSEDGIEEDTDFVDPTGDGEGYSSWFKTESYYISILNFCIIGLSAIFIACLLYWCYKCGGFQVCPCKCCKNYNAKQLEMVYDEDGHYRYKHKEERERIDISDNEQYMPDIDDNDGTVHTPLLGGIDNEFRYQSFDLLSDV